MSAIEQRARELLAAEFEKDGESLLAKGCLMGWRESDCPFMRAIIAALTPPEGFVLVPVEPTKGMLRAPTRIVCGHRQETIAKMYHAMLAARPEVP